MSVSELQFEDVIEGRFKGYDIEFDNPEIVTKLLGFTNEDWESPFFPFEEFLSPDKRHLLGALKRLREAPGTTELIPVRIASKNDGIHHLEFVARQIGTSEWTEFIARDVTEQVRREEEIARNARTEGVQLAARTMIHHIRTSLQPASGYALLLAGNNRLEEAHRSMAREAQDGIMSFTDRLRGLVLVSDYPPLKDVEFGNGVRAYIIDLDVQNNVNGGG